MEERGSKGCVFKESLGKRAGSGGGLTSADVFVMARSFEYASII